MVTRSKVELQPGDASRCDDVCHGSSEQPHDQSMPGTPETRHGRDPS